MQNPGPVAIFFSEQERRVLRRLFGGWAYKQIAHDLGIAEKTVQFHVCALLRKLGLRDRVELQIWCLQNPEGASRGVTRTPGLHADDCSCGSHYCETRRSLEIAA